MTDTLTPAQPTIPGIDLTPTGVAAPLHQLELTAIVHACAQLANAHTITNWALGDLAAELWRRDDAAGLRALDTQGHDQATLARVVAVSMAIPAERRHAGLSWSHHEIVAKQCPNDPDTQDDWLTRAAQAGWTARDLRHQIDDADNGQDRLPGMEKLPRPPESRLRAALKESPVIMWVPGVGQLSAAHVRHINTLNDGQTVAVVTIDPAMATTLPIEDAA